jgi:hypothetical protein
VGNNHNLHFPEQVPSGEIGAELAKATIEGTTASLHLEDGEVLWLRVEHEKRVLFEHIGAALLVVGRTRERGPFYLTGSFVRQPARARQVTVEAGQAPLETISSDEGWLCLTPSAFRGPVKIVWLDEEGRQYQAVEHPALDNVGVLGPTFYGPPLEPCSAKD